MQVIHGSKNVPVEARGAVLAIGNFDGVHRGHQALIAAARQEAKRIGRCSGAILFEPHPRAFFEPGKPHFRLTSLPRKLELLEEHGLDLAVVLRFDAALAGLTAEDFIARVLVEGLGASHIVVGYDFHFGKGRSGSPQTLRRAGQAHGFGVTVVSPVADGGQVFSSGAIRAALARGDVKAAAEALGHWWRVVGKVVGGAHRGEGLGFPTANVALPPGTTFGHGIYAVRVHVGAERYDGAAYLGTRPMFDNGEPVLEVFLLDFDGNLYGREIAVEFIDFVRADATFASIEALKVQMAEDCARARTLLGKAPDKPRAGLG